ncbi:MAG: hypothetical protein IKV98_09740 [Clostridia bacterium]|nr:hypothetical protein [Clostridia bacterium]
MTMITMIRKIRNAAIAVSILFVCGILGSLELDAISLSQAIEYITVSAAFCGFVLTLEVIFRFARALLVVYARRKRAFRRISAPKCRKASANAPFVREYYA